MSERLSRCFDCRGQITIYLSLMFFILLGVVFLILNGMRGYLQTSLQAESAEGAGQDILADYDKPLYERYHLFFMDPREESYIEQDAKEYIQHYFKNSSYFTPPDISIEITSEKKAAEEEGEFVFRQIQEWEKSQGVKKVSDLLNLFVERTDQNHGDSKQMIADIDKNVSSEKEKQKEKDSKDIEEKEESSEEKKLKATWQELKNTLEGIFKSGVLSFVADNSKELSELEIDSTELLSRKKGVRDGLTGGITSSLTAVSELKDMLSSKDVGHEKVTLATSEYFLISYIIDCFTSYDKSDKKEKHVLEYEIEYLLAGKYKDKDNLKKVVEQILRLRFVTNYGYASTDYEIKLEAQTMAAILSGILGFPEIEKGVEALLIAALCYGESLIEVRALLHGGRVPIIKTKENWNLSFQNVAHALKTSSEPQKCSDGVSYEDYLKILLIFKAEKRSLLFRMMDVMQENIQLDEPSFLFEDSLYSFIWKAGFQWKNWFGFLPGLQITPNKVNGMVIEQQYQYH